MGQIITSYASFDEELAYVLSGVSQIEKGAVLSGVSLGSGWISVISDEACFGLVYVG